MKKSFLLFIIFLIFVFSSITFYMIINYFDPYANTLLAIIFVLFTFTLSVSTFFTLLIFFIKKIHYRGRVELFHIKSSFRQGFFIGLILVGILFFKSISAPIFILGFLLIIIFSFLELFIQNLDY